MDSLDDIPEEEAPVPPMYRNSDHVSCEDLLDFACDLPNSKRYFCFFFFLTFSVYNSLKIF